MRSPKGVKSDLLGRVPAGCLLPTGTGYRVPAVAQAPDLQAPDFVAPLDKSVRVPGCLLDLKDLDLGRPLILAGTQAPVRFCWQGPRNRVPAGRVPAHPQAPDINVNF